MSGSEPTTAGGTVAAVSLTGVSKRYGGHQALTDVDVSIRRGEVVALLGANGAGKTTLLSIIAGLRPATTGTVRVHGVDVQRRSPDDRAALGFAPQELALYLPLTARENLQLFGSLVGMRGAQLDARMHAVAEDLGFVPLLGRRVDTLSGGEQRRVHVAIALLHRPPLLLLDEPTLGADIETSARVLAHLRDLTRQDSAVLWSTHHLHEVETLGARVIILHDGRMIADARVQDLVDAHGGDPVVEVRVGGGNPVSVRDRLARLASSEVELVDDDGVVLRVRTSRPDSVAASVLDTPDLRGDIAELRVARPSLETAYRALTSTANR